jgi:hypothetical protein
MSFEEIVARFAQSALTGSKSTALKPILALDGLFLAALVACNSHWLTTPDWVRIFISVGLGVSLIVTLFTYVYFVVKDPDALRSEHYLCRSVQQCP